jgi:hypothetical protein
MFRTHGRPDLQREDEAIDELGVRIRRVRRVLLALVVGLSLVASLFTAWAAATFGNTDLGAAITGKALGLLAAGALFGTMFGGHAVTSRLTVAWAERAARGLARARRCEEGPLVDAARLIAGGRPPAAEEPEPPSPPRRKTRRFGHRVS